VSRGCLCQAEGSLWQAEVEEESLWQPEGALTPKAEGSEIAQLRAGLPFPCIYLSGNIFLTFFRQRKIDEESNTSRFVFFEALSNYL